MQHINFLGGEYPSKFNEDKNFKFQGVTYPSFVNVTANYSELLSFYEKGLVDRTNTSGRMREVYDRLYNSERDDWTGGGVFDIRDKNPDTSTFNEVKEKISRDAVWKRITFQMQNNAVRKRSRSEYDGDFDFDKRMDIAPFFKREMKKEHKKILKLKVDASFHCGVDATQIDGYGAYIAALVTEVEKNGIQVELYTCYTVTGLPCGKTETPVRVETLLKRSDEYLPVSVLLKIISGNWFRRIGFSQYVAAAAFINCETDSGLGSPYPFARLWECKDDVVHIYSIPSYEDQKQILEELGKTLFKKD